MAISTSRKERSESAARSRSIRARSTTLAGCTGSWSHWETSASSPINSSWGDRRGGTVATDVTGTAIPTAQAGMFVRNATGLVREVRPWQAMAINFITGAPPFVIGIALFGALSGFQGGNFWLVALLTIQIALGVVYAFGFMTAAIPRSGGDYVIVSRTLHPALATVSASCISLSSFLSMAFEALFFVIAAVAPGLMVIGIVGHHHRLVSWGNTVASSHNWQFGLGSAAIIVAGVAVGAGWTWAKRFMFTLLGFSLLGLVIATLVAWIAGKHTFIGDPR